MKNHFSSDLVPGSVYKSVARSNIGLGDIDSKKAYHASIKPESIIVILEFHNAFMSTTMTISTVKVMTEEGDIGYQYHYIVRDNCELI